VVKTESYETKDSSRGEISGSTGTEVIDETANKKAAREERLFIDRRSYL